MNYRDVYKVLVDAGARPDDEDEFVCVMESGASEYRFCGKLGFGGKYRRGNFVDLYREDETADRLRLVRETNARLAALASRT